MVTKRQIEKTTVYLLFSLFVQFSAIEIRRVFSHTKLTISWLQWLEKGWGARAHWSAIAIFNWQSSISRQFKADRLQMIVVAKIRHVFNVRVHERVLNDAINYSQKGCAMQMLSFSQKNEQLDKLICGNQVRKLFILEFSFLFSSEIALK